MSLSEVGCEQACSIARYRSDRHARRSGGNWYVAARVSPEASTWFQPVSTYLPQRAIPVVPHMANVCQVLLSAGHEDKAYFVGPRHGDPFDRACAPAETGSGIRAPGAEPARE